MSSNPMPFDPNQQPPGGYHVPGNQVPGNQVTGYQVPGYPAPGAQYVPGVHNPYQAPPVLAALANEPVPGEGFSFEDLRKIARIQRWLVTLVGLQLLVMCGGGFGLGFIMPLLRPPPGQGMFSVLGALVIVVWSLFTLALSTGTALGLAMMANRLWGLSGAVICGGLGFVPGIAFVALLVTNGQATSVLQRHGFTVGLLGCDDPRLR